MYDICKWETLQLDVKKYFCYGSIGEIFLLPPNLPLPLEENTNAILKSVERKTNSWNSSETWLILFHTGCSPVFTGIRRRLMDPCPHLPWLIPPGTNWTNFLSQLPGAHTPFL